MTVTQQRYDSIVITTTPSLDGRRITRYAGIVNPIYVIGAGIVGGITAMFSDIAGSRNRTYGDQLDIASAEVMKELKIKALEMSNEVDAIVGLKVDYTVTGQNNLLIVAATGTAVESRTEG